MFISKLLDLHGKTPAQWTLFATNVHLFSGLGQNKYQNYWLLITIFIAINSIYLNLFWENSHLLSLTHYFFIYQMVGFQKLGMFLFWILRHIRIPMISTISISNPVSLCLNVINIPAETMTVVVQYTQVYSGDIGSIIITWLTHRDMEEGDGGHQNISQPRNKHWQLN